MQNLKIIPQRFYSLFFIGLLLLCFACKEDPTQMLINKTWVHSFEEDKGEIKCFRSDDYEFPPARGREKVSIKAGGKLTYYQIGPADGYVDRNGKWELIDNTTVKITLFANKSFFKDERVFHWKISKISPTKVFVETKDIN